MKKLFFLCAVLAGTVTNGQVKFITEDWSGLLKEAKAQNKYVYIDGYTDWCGWCKVLDKNTLSDTMVGNFMNAHFISAKMEMEKDEWGKKIALKYAVDVFPTGLVFNSDGKLVYVLTGYSPSDHFLKSIKKSVSKENQLNLKGFSKKFDLVYPYFYLKAMAGNGKREFPKDEQVNGYLQTQKDKFSESAWVIWKRFGYQLNEANKKFFLENSAEFKELYGREDVEDIITNFASKMVEGAIATKDKNELDEAMRMIDRYISEPEKVKISYMAVYYKKTGNWKSYNQCINKQMNIDPDMSGETINEIAWDIYKDCNDTAVILDAVKWMDEVVKKAPEYNSMDTYAALLYKAKKYNEARKEALMAIDLGKAKNLDVSSTEKLLEEIKSAR